MSSSGRIKAGDDWNRQQGGFDAAASSGDQYAELAASLDTAIRAPNMGRTSTQASKKAVGGDAKHLDAHTANKEPAATAQEEQATPADVVHAQLQVLPEFRLTLAAAPRPAGPSTSELQHISRLLEKYNIAEVCSTHVARKAPHLKLYRNNRGKCCHAG